MSYYSRKTTKDVAKYHSYELEAIVSIYRYRYRIGTISGIFDRYTFCDQNRLQQFKIIGGQKRFET